MTLKTFHFAGVASMNVTLGVPRINEIINATKIISTPIITTTLVNQNDAISARIVKGRLETTVLGDICKYIKEVYSPKGCYLSIKLDMEVIEALKLELSMDMIIDSILKTRKMKPILSGSVRFRFRACVDVSLSDKVSYAASSSPFSARRYCKM